MSQWVSGPGWKPLTGLNEKSITRGRLLGALMTTFDPPDPSVLIEDYLPVWLELENSYSEEGTDRLRYFAQLEQELRRLKGRIAIVSSAGEVASSVQAWIWNYISRFEVGALRAAIQHAKLWIFHRAPTEEKLPETLEMIISSANLTRDGLRGQIQAGWRCVLPLGSRGSDARGGTWGILPTFLAELGKALGSGGQAMMDRWIALLHRCACPVNVEFIASVPGSHSRTTLRQRDGAWGAAGLRAVWSGRSSPTMAVLAPTIGKWTARNMKAWAAIAGVEVARVSLAWVGAGHPWVGKWQLDGRSERGLTRSGIRWLEFPMPGRKDWNSPLCREHLATDTRWCHAKLYELRQGTRRRLLITSANLSRAAWGDPQSDGGLVIDNFELGVLVPVREGFSDHLKSEPYLRGTCDVNYAQPQEPPIGWLSAQWDGRKLMIECRPSQNVVLASRIEITLTRAPRSRRESVRWSKDPVPRAIVPWPARRGIPLLVSVRTVTGDTRLTAVQDLRKTEDGQILCAEFKENLLREALDLLLEEKYGYLPLAGANGDGDGEGTWRLGGAASAGHYSVQAYVDARRRFHLIDNWWKELCSADDRTRSFIVKDGLRICERWRTAAETVQDSGLRLAARVAADELSLRIRRLK